MASRYYALLPVLAIWLNAEVCGGAGRPKVTIEGGGATIPLDVYKALQPAYQAMRMRYADVSVLYRGVGSGTGIQMLRNDVLDFAGSDAEPSSDGTDDDLQYFPVMTGSVSVVYNLPDDLTNSSAKSLKLTPEALVGIFNGTIRLWNDPILVQKNGFLRSANHSIIVVVRADNSGTTHIFTKSLAAFNSRWNREVNTFSQGCNDAMEPIRWNKSMTVLCGKRSRGASGIVLNMPYSVGYLGSSDARDSVLPDASIQNENGEWTSPATDTDETTNTADSLAAEDTSGSAPSSTDTYPISAFTYLVTKKNPLKNCTILMELYRYFRFVLEDPIARSTISNSVRIPVSREAAKTTRETILDKLVCEGQLVARLVEIETKTLNGDYDRWQVPVAVCLALLGTLGGSIGAFFLYHFYLRYQDVLKATYIIVLDEHVPANHSQLSVKSKGSFMTAVTIGSTLFTKDFGTEHQVVRLRDDQYRLAQPLLQQLNDPETFTWATRKTMIRMRNFAHANITSFFGDFLLKRDAYPEVVTFSLSRDLIEGLAFLHKQGIAHGQLSTHSCFVDHQWNGVIGDWEQYALTVAQQCFFIAFDYFYTAAKTSQDEAPNEQKIETYHSRLLYVAPELLRRDAAGLYIVQSADIRADIYSLGVILYEIFTSCSPYEDLLDSHNSASSILTAVKYKKIRPKIPQNLLHERPNIFALIRSMWAEDSSERLTIMGVKKVSNGFFPKRKALMDNMLQSMENHNSYLEDQLTEKQTELETATRKLEDIREAHVPAAVAHACSYPSTFESIPVCVLTSTDLSSTITQLGITDAFVFLEKFQNYHDGLLAKYNISKADSAGHASIYLAGLSAGGPSSSASSAEDAADFALSLVEGHQNILPDFLGEKNVRWQAGLHFGSVTGGLVNVLKVPRFYVLGETVTTAFELHSSSLPTRVRISDTFKNQLGFIQKYRIEAAMKAEDESRETSATSAFWLSRNDSFH